MSPLESRCGAPWAADKTALGKNRGGEKGGARASVVFEAQGGGGWGVLRQARPQSAFDFDQPSKKC